MRYYYIILLFCSSMGFAQFTPIIYDYVNTTPESNLAYLAKNNYLYMPYESSATCINLDYLDSDSLDLGQSYKAKYPGCIADISPELQEYNYALTTDEFVAYQKAHSDLLVDTKFDPNIQRKRQQRFNRANKMLVVVLAKYPELKSQLESSAAYGILEITSFTALLYAGSFGSGMLFDNIKKTTKYIDTFRAGTGLGVGYIDNYTLIIFHKHFAVEQYLGAGGVGGDVSAVGTVGIWNRSLSFNPTISMYHIFNYGADLQVTWGATAYWLSPGLN